MIARLLAGFAPNGARFRFICISGDAGVAQADLVQAGRLQSPSFSFLRTRAGSDIGIERSLGVNFIAALTLPLAGRIEARRFEQTRLLVAAQMLRHAAATKGAWVEAVAALQGACKYFRLQ